VYHAAPWTAADAALTFCLALATFLAIPIITGASLGGIVVAELLGLAAVPVIAVRVRGLPLATIGLRRPSALALAGAVLIGLTLWYVEARITAPWARLLGDHGASIRDLEKLVRTGPVAIVLLSLGPAIGEELATRGVLALGLARRLGGIVAVLISAAAFAALHFSLVRALPTFILGACLATITLRTRSVVPAILAHALNNATAMILATAPPAALVAAIDGAPDVALGVALMLATGGIALCRAAETRL